MSYLARLKQEISLKEPRSELTEPTKVPSVSFVSDDSEASRDISCDESEKWREFEMLLAIVGPTYKTPDDEYAQIRAMARRDLPAALSSYRILLKQRTSEGALNE